MEENCNFNYKVLTKCGQTLLFVNLSNLFFVYSFHKVISYKFC